MLISVQKSRCQQLRLIQKLPRGQSLDVLKKIKRVEAFLEVASYLEDNDDELITTNDLHESKIGKY